MRRRDFFRSAIGGALAAVAGGKAVFGQDPVPVPEPCGHFVYTNRWVYNGVFGHYCLQTQWKTYLVNGGLCRGQSYVASYQVPDSLCY